jgi:hypothetical protein
MYIPTMRRNEDTESKDVQKISDCARSKLLCSLDPSPITHRISKLSYTATMSIPDPRKEIHDIQTQAQVSIGSLIALQLITVLLLVAVVWQIRGFRKDVVVGWKEKKLAAEGRYRDEDRSN